MRNPFRYFNSSPEIIRLAVMMYVRFPLSLRQVEDLLSERGIDICHETVRYWWNRFGPLFAAEIRKRRVLIVIGIRTGAGTLMRCSCGSTGRPAICGARLTTKAKFKVFATKRRDRRAALRFLKRAMKRYGRPASIVTDGLPSYRAAMPVIGNAASRTRGR